jgi:hypothetical protein
VLKSLRIHRVDLGTEAPHVVSPEEAAHDRIALLVQLLDEVRHSGIPQGTDTKRYHRAVARGSKN